MKINLFMIEFINKKGSEDSKNNPSNKQTLDWTELISKTIERLTGKDLRISYLFDNLEIDIPKTSNLNEKIYPGQDGGYMVKLLYPAN